MKRILVPFTIAILSLLVDANRMAVAQPVSQIYTTFNGFWNSAVGTLQPDTSHNLLAFKVGTEIYATGVDNAKLTAMGVTYNHTSFEAFPAPTLAVEPVSSSYVGVGARYMGDGDASTVSITLDLAEYLSDGIKGLDLGTGVFNLPITDISYKVSTIEAVAIFDNVPDILVTQVGQPATSIYDSFRFVNAYGVTVGNPVAVKFNAVGSTGVGNWKFYTTMGEGAPMYAPSVSSPGHRDIRMVAYKLSDFGITAENKDQVVRFVHKLSGASDVAFMAYNSSSLTATTSSTPGCLPIHPHIWVRANSIQGIEADMPIPMWDNEGSAASEFSNSNNATRPLFGSAEVEGFNYNSYVNTQGGHLSMPNPFGSTHSGPAEIFIVSRTKSSTGKQRLMNFATNTSVSSMANNRPTIGYDSARFYLQHATTSYLGSNNSGQATNLLSYKYDNTTITNTFSRNGTLETTFVHNTDFSGNYAMIGGSGNVDLAEIVVFPSALSDSNRAQVETYLAVKYGLPLSKVYLSGNYTSIWNYFENTTYNHRMMGIGRDDCQQLHQKQSRSEVDEDYRLIASLGTLANTVAENSSGFTYDGQYIIYGDDNGALSNISTSYVKNTCFKHTDRHWLAQVTGTNTGDINTQIRIKVSDIAFEESMGATQFVLLLDRDNNGSYNDGVDVMYTSSSYSDGYAVFNNVKWNPAVGKKIRFTVGVKKPGPVPPSVTISPF